MKISREKGKRGTEIFEAIKTGNFPPVNVRYPGNSEKNKCLKHYTDIYIYIYMYIYIYIFM